MPFPTQSLETIRDRILRDISSQDNDADISTDSDNYVRATADAAAIEGLYQFQAWLYRQIFPDTADLAELVKYAAERGLSRKPARAATGKLSVTGIYGTTLPAGSSVRHVNGTMLVTTLDTPVGADGTAVVAVAAAVAGAVANGIVGNATITSPPLGIDAAAVVSTALANGSDIESQASLLDRYLTLLRRPPAGGNHYDYKRWAESIPGVASAYVYPLRRGLGTVDIVIVGPDGLPSDELIAQVQTYIDDQRPVTAWNCLVFAPTIINVDHDAKVKLTDGYQLADALTDAKAQLAALFANLAPGDTYYRSRGEAALSGISGVIDRELIAPAANVEATVDASQVQWLRLGAVTLELM
ncbi:baseplate J/gp47 family protein [Luteibacter aegosomatis]|uniref:baseplate J/gp47 family protein n=1 Tax=Luteibacter aegosomatis TaxID=2911537 RepID=UPI001FF81F2F|nr:baseplate J/gp47 family protein [Luteibacter aegosomatis]UPG87037.1 baseplate J/gp47 family protein [Luteibacter aegosomatis]